MPASQQHLTDNTALGATLLNDGATFRCWAPNASAVYVAFPPAPIGEPWPKPESQRLVRDARGFWGGFFPGVQEGDTYRFYVVGEGSEGFKRDPYARELAFDNYPNCACVVRSPTSYPWRDADFSAPAFSELVVYQFHFGVSDRQCVSSTVRVPLGRLALRPSHGDGRARRLALLPRFERHRALRQTRRRADRRVLGQ